MAFDFCAINVSEWLGPLSVELLLKVVKVLNANLSPVDFLKLMSVVNSVPHEWMQIIRHSTHLPSYICYINYLRM